MEKLENYFVAGADEPQEHRPIGILGATAVAVHKTAQSNILHPTTDIRQAK